MNESSALLRVKEFKIAEELFEKGFPVGGGPCACTSLCCSGGVYVDFAERDRILGHKEIIKRQMDDSQTTDDTQWFDHDEREDDDFPSGHCVGTAVINDKCAFLKRDGHCSIQDAAVAEGLHKWAWKPLFCVLYPVEISEKVIGFDPMLQNDQPCCSIDENFTIPFFEGAREELTYLLGEDGFAQMRERYAQIAEPRLREREIT